jgi:hypothetical protein
MKMPTVRIQKDLTIVVVMMGMKETVLIVQQHHSELNHQLQQPLVQMDSSEMQVVCVKNMVKYSGPN